MNRPRRSAAKRVKQEEEKHPFVELVSDDSSESEEEEEEEPIDERLPLSLLTRTNKGKKPHHYLPNEILVKIFEYLTSDHSSSSSKTLVNLCLVCEEWRQLVLSSRSLWRYIDMSIFRPTSSAALMEFSKLNLFQQAYHINFTGWDKILDRHTICLIFRTFHRLKSIVLNGCYSFDSQGLSLLSQNEDLEEIDFSGIYTGGILHKKDKNSASFPLFSSLENFLRQRGEKLKSINLSQNRLIRYNQIFKSILENCPNLECLDLSNIIGQSHSIKVDFMEKSCPNLKIIRLGNTQLIPGKYNSSGFLKLEELSIPCSNSLYDFGHNDDVLLSFAQNSPNLKLLDIRGSQRITACCLLQLKTDNLQHLAIDGCYRIFSTGLDLVLARWKHSLIELDISLNNCSEKLEDGIRALTDGESIPLETINLRGSSVSFTAVMCLVVTCSELKFVDLQSCRALPRGTKRVFKGLPEIRKLRSEILKCKFEEEKSIIKSKKRLKVAR